MGRTLLIGSPTDTWRHWIVDQTSTPEVLCLDPTDTDFGLPGRITYFESNAVRDWRFIGSLSVHRAPHTLLSGLFELLPVASPDCIVQVFPHYPSPLMHQLISQIAFLLQPSKILLSTHLDWEHLYLPVNPEKITPEKGRSSAVRSTQRKAKWLEHFEQCEMHEISLPKIAIEGARLGAGSTIDASMYSKLAIEHAQHVEICHKSLLIVSAAEISQGQIARALDVMECEKAFVVHPDQYSGLCCAFARENGEEFGFGFIRKIDFEKQIAYVQSDAIAPAPVKILRIGSLRVDQKGRELGETKPWEV